MDRQTLNDIRRDLDVLFPDGGYELAGKDAGRLRLTLPDDTHVNVRRFAEETLRTHGVHYEVVVGEARFRRGPRRATPVDHPRDAKAAKR